MMEQPLKRLRIAMVVADELDRGRRAKDEWYPGMNGGGDDVENGTRASSRPAAPTRPRGPS